MKGQIVVDQLCKNYVSYQREMHRFLSWMGFAQNPKTSSQVLKNISFKIGPGESVGIVGQNGAGKSTLLKILTGTTAPSSGSFKLDGKISAILELGMGFNLEFSGRQNAFHVATLMGHSAEAIDKVMPEIKLFSEIGDYFEQPARTYSSGMQMRVAFAVATAFRPDFLIVDEALAVGDAYFQYKSFSKIREFKKLGTTILFVSHDRNAITSLCERCILLYDGRVEMDGRSDKVMDYYNAMLAAKDGNDQSIQQKSTGDGRLQTLSGNQSAKLEEIHIKNRHQEKTNQIYINEPTKIVARIRAFQNLPQLVLGVSIRNKFGQVFYGTNTFLKNKILNNVLAGEVYDFEFDFINHLGLGNYSISTSLHVNQTHLDGNIEWIDQAMLFDVIAKDAEDFEGLVNLDASIEINRIQD